MYETLLSLHDLTVKWAKPPLAIFFKSSSVQILGKVDRHPRYSEWQGHLNRTVIICDQIIKCIGAYILPLLYGLLGAIVFILRSLTRSIQNHTYLAYNKLIYAVRIQLGGLSGLAVGWILLVEEHDPGLGVSVFSLSPFALAFVAGYSVEILFSAIDKIIN